jgi:YVTN family beta-propeller protein
LMLSSTKEAVIEFRVLGPLQVVKEGHVLPLGGIKQRGLLALLLFDRNHVVPRDRLVDALWGDRPPPSAANSVQVYVSKLRRVLEDGRRDGGSVLVTEPPGYLLRVPAGALDAEEFEGLLSEGKAAVGAGAFAEGEATLAQALSIWRGPALADLDSELFAKAEISRLEGLRLQALMARFEAMLAVGRQAEAVGGLQSLVRLNPLDERLHAQLLVALYRSGRQAEALETYRSFRRLLHDELGLEPSAELRELEQAILRQDASLARVPSQAPTVAAGEDAVEEARPAPAPTSRRRSRSAGRRRLALAVAAVVFAAAAAALAFVLRSESDRLSSISPNAVGAIDATSGEIVGEVAVGRRPEGLAVDEGAVWVTNFEEGTISQIDPETRSLVRTISTGDYPSDIALGKVGGPSTSRGADVVWTGLTELRDRVLAEAPTTNAEFFVGKLNWFERRSATQDSATLEGLVCRSPAVSLALGRSAVWFACDTYLGRVDPRTGKVSLVSFEAAPVDYPSAIRRDFSDVAFGLGSLWLANRVTNTVIEIDPSTRREVREITVGEAPTSVAVGAGSVWAASFDDDTLTRIEVTGPGDPVTLEPITVGDGPVAVAVGEGGVWVANSLDGTVSRVDPSTNEVVTSINVGNEPRRVAVGNGTVWVTVRGAVASAGR